MKKIIAILILSVIICPPSHAWFGKNKKKKLDGKGYYGTLPNINSEFGDEKKKNKATHSPIILNDGSFDVNTKDLKEAPLNNTQYKRKRTNYHSHVQRKPNITSLWTYIVITKVLLWTHH